MRGESLEESEVPGHVGVEDPLRRVWVVRGPHCRFTVNN